MTAQSHSTTCKGAVASSGCRSTTRTLTIWVSETSVSCSNSHLDGPANLDLTARRTTADASLSTAAGGSPDRIGGSWQLRRIASVVVNGKTDEVQSLYQRDSHKGIILSTPLELELSEGSNTITIGGLFNGQDYKGADIDRIIVYPVAA